MDLKVVISLRMRESLSPWSEDSDMEKSRGITLTIALMSQKAASSRRS